MIQLLKFLRSLPLCIASLVTVKLNAFDTAHFFRPPFFFGEPRFEKPLLSSLLIEAAHGSSSCARDCSGDKVPLLDIYGLSSFNSKDPNQPEVSLLSKVHVTELVIDWCQNFTHGFFFETQIPFRMLKLDPIQMKARHNENFSSESIDSQLALAHLKRTGYCKRGIGDPGIALGWTSNYENTHLLDFIDSTIRFGVLLPISKQVGVGHLFDIPLGNNGHTGFFAIADLSSGIYDWITLGAHASVLGFLNNREQLRVGTGNQKGLFTTEQLCVSTHRGTIYDAGLYLKADHLVMGFSLLLGYQYQNQQADRLKAGELVRRSLGAGGWSMHTWHTQIEYDFATYEHPHAPRIGLLWNQIITGKRIFLPSMFGGYLGFDICWCW